MSRETDTPAPGPAGREPYGRPGPADAGDGDVAGAPAEKKTETTVTTRIRINIPGSRPIPPVVVREQVTDAGPAVSGTDGGGSEGAPSPAPPASPERPGGTARPAGGTNGAGRKTSSWFEPRKSGPSGATPPRGTPAPPVGGAGGGTNGVGIPSPARPPGDTLPPSDPGTGGTLPAPMIDPSPGGEPAGGPIPPLPRRDSGAALRQPAGPTTGPGTGAMEPPPGGPREDAGGFGTPSGGVPAVAGEENFGSTMEPGGPLPHADTPPRSPLADRGTGAWSPRDSEATEAMPRLPEPFGTGSTTGARPGPVDGARFPAPAFGTAFGEEKPDHEADPDDYYEGYEEYDEEEPRRGRGRKLLILALVGVAGLFVVAYGAGLLLSQDDVPKGTTVLGHDIGGTTTQTAVNRLDTVMEGPATAPLLLGIEGETVELLPAVAGLTIDTEATVRDAASTDYNPVSVIGSLLGSGREVEPVFGVDEEKLDAALLDLADIGAAAPRDGSISFDTGAPVADYGQPGLAVDVASAAPAVREVFRLRAETGENPTVDVQTVEVEPEVGRAEVERAMEEFAEPAMSGLVTIVAGTDGVPGVAPTIQFSPENSLRQFLSMRPVDGRLVDHYDLETMASLYGSTFEQVTIVRGDGQSTPVTPEDVASVLRLTLLETGEENRVGYLDLDPN